MKKLLIILWVLLNFTSYSKSQPNSFYWNYAPVPAVCDPLAIGCAYQGGYIAYIYQSGDPGYVSGEVHGFVVSQGYITIGVTITWYWWNGTYTTTGATGTALGTAATNTTAIVASQGIGSYGAYLCLNYENGGYSDWYMPSKDELHKIYLAKDAIGGSWISGSATPTYMSSSEYDIHGAWIEDFRYGNQWHSVSGCPNPKSDCPHQLCPIRYF
jgi:hypothetical protein